MVLQVRDALGGLRFAFRPVVHLRTGGVVALEARAHPAAGELDDLRSLTGLAERLIQFDVKFAAEAARRATEHERLLPLHLALWTDTVCAEHDPLRPLLDTVADVGRDPAQVVIRLVMPPDRSAPQHLGTGLARLRAAGFGVGLDAVASYPITTLIDARPEVLLLTARHIAGPATTATGAAALAGSVALAAQLGSTLIADGIDTAEQAAALRHHGASLVQGQLLGPPHRRPRTQPVPAVVLDQLTAAPEAAGASNGRPDPAAAEVAAAPAPEAAVAADLAHPAAAMPGDTTGETARSVFADRPELTGLVLVDEHQRPLLSLNRDRFMLAITGPFGYSLYANRPAAGLGDPPRTLHLEASLADAVDMVATAPTQRMYDDIVLIDGQGRCQGVLRVRDLVRDLAQRRTLSPDPTGTARGRPDCLLE